MHRVALFPALLLLAAPAWAKSIDGATANPNWSIASAEVQLLITFGGSSQQDISSSCDYIVQWGDGSTDEKASSGQATSVIRSHVYAQQGRPTIVVMGAGGSAACSGTRNIPMVVQGPTNFSHLARAVITPDFGVVADVHGNGTVKLDLDFNLVGPTFKCYYNVFWGDAPPPHSYDYMVVRESSQQSVTHGYSTPYGAKLPVVFHVRVQGSLAQPTCHQDWRFTVTLYPYGTPPLPKKAIRLPPSNAATRADQGTVPIKPQPDTTPQPGKTPGTIKW